MTALSQMGHATDKIELIVLGGTWSDYPEGYQTWFMSELFRALNDDAVAGVAANPMLARPGISRAEAGRLLDDAPADALPPVVTERRERYRAAGIATDEAELASGVADERGRVDAAVVAITARCVVCTVPVRRGARLSPSGRRPRWRSLNVSSASTRRRSIAWWGSLSRRAPMP